MIADKTSFASPTPPVPVEHSAIWLVAIIGLSLSWAALWMIQQQLDAHKQLDFDWVAHNRIRAVNQGIENGLGAIETVGDVVRGMQHVDSEAFEVLGRSLLERYPGIQALLWVPRVAAGSRTAYEEGTGASITGQDGGYEVLPSGARDVYFPVTFLVPKESKTYVPGFDLGSVPLFAEVLDRARDIGQMAASGRIVEIEQESERQYGFLVALPIYSDGSAHELAERRARLSGFVVGHFRLRGLTSPAISILEPRGVEVLIRDESAESGEAFLHFYESRLAPREAVFAGEPWSDPDEPKVAETIRVADREWSIVCGRTNQFRSAEAFEESPWVALIAGLVFTALLSFYLARIKETDRQRLQMQRQLVEREELFRQMTETVDEVFWAITGDGSRVLYLSPAYERIFETGKGRYDRRNSTILKAISQDDQERLVRGLREIRHAGSATQILHRVMRTDGTTRWVRTRGFPVRNDTGEIYRIVGFSEDVTETKLADEALRESEAKLRDMFQQSPDIIMTVDKSGEILLMNRAMPGLPADLSIGRSSLSLLPADFRTWYMNALHEAIETGRIEQFQYSTENSEYWEGRIVPIRGDGPITAAMVIASNITEKRSLEMQALRNARLASIGVLAAGVAHEINNPNNSILFNASLVSRAWEDITPILREYHRENGDFSLAGLSFEEAQDALPELVAEIASNADRIKRIVQNLKHMARQDTGQLIEEVDIEQILQNTFMILHNQIQRYTDSCVLEVPGGLPRVRGNSQQLEQVFINLTLNALQSLSDRLHKVFIRALLDESKDTLEITVRDEGRGISERDLGRVTEPFFTTKSEAEGTGLGLSISHAIIERHGGTMRFASKLGEGTTVTVNLPVLRSA